MSVPPGPVYGLLDPNGTGKTAMIRCLLDTLGPSAGGAEVLGQRVTLDGSALRSRVGYVRGVVRLHDRETGHWHLDYRHARERLRLGFEHCHARIECLREKLGEMAASATNIEDCTTGANGGTQPGRHPCGVLGREAVA